MTRNIYYIFRLVNVELKRELIGIDRDAVSLFDEANRSTNSRFGSNVSHDESVGAARRLRLRRSESGRGGARIGSARRKRDGSRADEAQRARDGHAVRARRARTMRRRKTKSGSTTTDDERERAQAETRAAQKRTREVVGVTRMQVEMVGTPRGVPLACSRGASGVPSA